MLTVSHTFEPAASGRAKCRGCGRAIARGEMRFGERLPNPFAEGEMTVWFHPLCAAYKRPEPVLQTLGETSVGVPDREVLERAARSSLAQRRLPRIDGAEKAPGAQARCRHCHEPIARGTWRIRLVFYQDGRLPRRVRASRLPQALRDRRRPGARAPLQSGPERRRTRGTDARTRRLIGYLPASPSATPASARRGLTTGASAP
jgi:hypothetical protein